MYETRKACLAESYSGHKKRAVFRIALVPQYDRLLNYRITEGEQVKHLPQASLIKGRFGGIVDIRLARLALQSPILDTKKEQSFKLLLCPE